MPWIGLGAGPLDDGVEIYGGFVFRNYRELILAKILFFESNSKIQRKEKRNVRKRKIGKRKKAENEVMGRLGRMGIIRNTDMIWSELEWDIPDRKLHYTSPNRRRKRITSWTI